MKFFIDTIGKLWVRSIQRHLHSSLFRSLRRSEKGEIFHSRISWNMMMQNSQQPRWQWSSLNRKGATGSSQKKENKISNQDELEAGNSVSEYLRDSPFERCQCWCLIFIFSYPFLKKNKFSFPLKRLKKFLYAMLQDSIFFENFKNDNL